MLIMYLLSTIFSCVLIHIWGTSEYLGQQDGVSTDHLVSLTDVFLIVFLTTVEASGSHE